MTVERFREIEAMMVDLDATLAELLRSGKITSQESGEWIDLEEEL